MLRLLLIWERGRRLHEGNHSRIRVIHHWLLHSGCLFNGLNAAVTPAKKRLGIVHDHWLLVSILLMRRTQHDLIALIIEWIIVVGSHHFVIVVSGGQRSSSLWHEQALCIRLHVHALRRLLVHLADLVGDISIKLLLMLHRIILLHWLRLVVLFVLIIQRRGRSTILL